MIITKANAKENLEQFVCLSITKAKAKTNSQIFICHRFRADGTSCGFWAEKGTATGPPGVDLEGGPAVLQEPCLNSTLGFTYC